MQAWQAELAELEQQLSEAQQQCLEVEEAERTRQRKRDEWRASISEAKESLKSARLAEKTAAAERSFADSTALYKHYAQADEALKDALKDARSAERAAAQERQKAIAAIQALKAEAYDANQVVEAYDTLEARALDVRTGRWELTLEGGKGSIRVRPENVVPLEMNIAESDIPEEFRCVITRELMERPVITSDGHTYERSAITKWLEEHGTSPKTGRDLPDKVLKPNHALRAQIIAFRETRWASPDEALADTASAVSAGLPVETDAIRGELLAALEVAEPEIRRLGTALKEQRKARKVNAVKVSWFGLKRSCPQQVAMREGNLTLGRWQQGGGGRGARKAAVAEMLALPEGRPQQASRFGVQHEERARAAYLAWRRSDETSLRIQKLPTDSVLLCFLQFGVCI
eukprot:g20942.t1